MDTLEPIEVEVQSHALVLPDQARAIVIRDARDFEQAGAFLKYQKRVLKEIAAYFKPMEDKADAAIEAAKASRNEIKERRAVMSAPALEAETIVKPLLEAYDAKTRAEAEQIQQDAIAAERARQQEALLAQAAKLERDGRHAMAEQVLAKAENPLVRVPTPVVPLVPKVSGVNFTTNWHFEIIDESTIKREYLVPDMTRIGKLTRVEHERAAELVGGIRVWSERTTRSTAG